MALILWARWPLNLRCRVQNKGIQRFHIQPPGNQLLFVLFTNQAKCQLGWQNCIFLMVGLGNLVNALIKTNNLSDLSSIPTARTNLVVPKGVDKQMCNEWAVFSSSTTGAAIGDSIGISSIVRTAVGKFTVNLTTPYPNANYCVVGRASSPGEGNGHELYVGGKTASSFNITTCTDSDNFYPTYDPPDVAIAIFGAKS